MSKIADLARELRDDFPAVDVTTVIFSAGFAGVGCCVIPQDKVLEIASALEGAAALVKALEETRDHLAFQHKWLSDQFDAMGRTRDDGTVGADTWAQIEATYALWNTVRQTLAKAGT